MFSREQRESRRAKKVEEAVDHVVERLANSDDETYTGITPHGALGYAVYEKTKKQRADEFVSALGQKGLAAIIYDGYTYRGDSASEVDPLMLYAVPKDNFLATAQPALAAPVHAKHVLRVWAQTVRSRVEEGGSRGEG
jgi:hypothetical protein